MVFDVVPIETQKNKWFSLTPKQQPIKQPMFLCASKANNNESQWFWLLIKQTRITHSFLCLLSKNIVKPMVLFASQAETNKSQWFSLHPKQKHIQANGFS